MRLYHTTLLFILLSGNVVCQQAFAAIALDRTRVIVNGNDKSVSLTVSNQNKQLPYLAQGWIEDEQGNKITTPMTVLPPIQRIEPGAESQVKVMKMPEVSRLPQDRESLFYFNIREIPPRSDKSNTLQIALQTRVKLFYRPQAIVPTKADMASPWQEKITLTRQGDRYQLNNPTPYFVTLVEIANSNNEKNVAGFEPVMVAPLSSLSLNVSAAALGHSPEMTYINDYGGRPTFKLQCTSNTCKAKPDSNRK